MKFGIVTLFPDVLTGFAELGVTGRAMTSGTVDVSMHNPREFCVDVHRTVDDRPYGGGPGMVMKCAPLAAAIDAARAALPTGSPVVMMSPQGRRFDQRLARECASWPGVVLVAGRYEGVDERLIADKVDQEWSLGDFVLSGGELAALVVLDTVTRLLPDVLGDPASAEQDSFMDGLLDHPHYTRPAEWQGRTVPTELLSGDHAAIRRWRLKQSLGRTWQRRPDLLAERSLTDEERVLLDEFRAEADG